MALQGKNLFLAVPTASGKSLVAYLAALKHVLERHGKVLYIVPLRALAAEKYDDLKRFEPLGVKVGSLGGRLRFPRSGAGQVRHHRRHLREGRLLAQAPVSSWLQKISLVVADEVHLIHDPERGPTLEITLTKFRKFNPDLQVIALSATVKNSEGAGGMARGGAYLLGVEAEPLKEGVYLDGEVRFTDNSKLEAGGRCGPHLEPGQGQHHGRGAVPGLRQHPQIHGSAGRQSATRMREILHEKVHLEDEESLLVDEGEPTSIGKRLRSCVHRGVAFHQRRTDQRAAARCVETAFKKGKIKCIVATPTLAAGINLPATAGDHPRRAPLRERRWQRLHPGDGDQADVRPRRPAPV